MPRRDVRMYLQDIIVACDALETHTQGRTFAEFVTNRTIRSACEREFTIIGEAVAQTLKASPALEQRITKAQSIVHFRHMLVHAYDVVKPEPMWEVIQNNIRPLRSEAAALLAQLGTQP
jgi:uncharacterized protein with HEPN domain